MNTQIFKGLINNIICSLESTPKATLTEIAEAVAMAELEETISIMCDDN